MKVRRTYSGGGGGGHTPYSPPGAKITGADIAILAGADPSAYIDLYYDALVHQAQFISGGGSVTLVTYASISGDPAAGIASYDLLVIARGDADDTVLDVINATDKPIIFMGSHLDTTRNFGMINGGQNEITASRDDIKIVAPQHPIIADIVPLNHLLTVRSSNNNMSVLASSDQPAGVQVIAEDPDVAGDAVIAAIEEGGTWFNPANSYAEEKNNTGRKVMLGWGYASPEAVEDIAVTLFLRAVGWCLNWY